MLLLLPVIKIISVGSILLSGQEKMLRPSRESYTNNTVYLRVEGISPHVQDCEHVESVIVNALPDHGNSGGAKSSKHRKHKQKNRNDPVSVFYLLSIESL